jgi:hypothetical protein
MPTALRCTVRLYKAVNLQLTLDFNRYSTFCFLGLTLMVYSLLLAIVVFQALAVAFGRVSLFSEKNLGSSKPFKSNSIPLYTI